MSNMRVSREGIHIYVVQILFVPVVAWLWWSVLWLTLCHDTILQLHIVYCCASFLEYIPIHRYGGTVGVLLTRCDLLTLLKAKLYIRNNSVYLALPNYYSFILTMKSTIKLTHFNSLNHFPYTSHLVKIFDQVVYKHENIRNFYGLTT